MWDKFIKPIQDKFCFFNRYTDISSIELNPKPKTVNPQILVLVINALEKDFIQSLRDKEKIAADDCEKLYRITQCLWLGSEREFNIRKNIYDNKKFEVDTQTESEYDVYVIQIKLEKYDDGFKPNINPLERIYAFRRLAGLPITISHRLKVEVYENTGVYSR